MFGYHCYYTFILSPHHQSGGLSTGVCGYPVIILGRPEYTTQLIVWIIKIFNSLFN